MKPLPSDEFALHIARDAAGEGILVAEEQPSAELAAWIAGRAEATAFHTPAWMAAISDATGHAAYHLVVRDAASLICGYLPLHHIKSALFGAAMVSSGFAVGGGIIATDQGVADALAQAAWEKTAALGISSLELRGGMLPSGSGWTQIIDKHLGFVAPILPDSDAQLTAIPRKHRAEVRKGLACDLRVSIGRDAAHRAAHYAVYAESVRNLGTPVFPKSLFDAVLNGFGDAADILIVWQEQTPVAAVLSLYHRGIVMPYWGGGTQAARSLRANERMYFALMDHARGRGCTAFDFGRSKAGSGPAAFKKNWGFEPQPLSYAIRTADGVAVRDINPLSPKYRLKISLWQKLPLWLANRIGPIIARGLG
jgi:FemAB-related protein (PEP-CTERM system-associated)